MLIDYPGVWTSTYNMLEQMVLRRNIVASILESVDNINQEMVHLTNDQWKIMEDLVNVLEPFKVTIITLSEEKMPIISLLRPLLWQLVSSHLKVKPSDNETAKSFKASLSDMLFDRYIDVNVTLLLQIATTLDPRYTATKVFKLTVYMIFMSRFLLLLYVIDLSNYLTLRKRRKRRLPNP